MQNIHEFSRWAFFFYHLKMHRNRQEFAENNGQNPILPVIFGVAAILRYPQVKSGLDSHYWCPTLVIESPLVFQLILLDLKLNPKTKRNYMTYPSPVLTIRAFKFMPHRGL